MLKYKAELTGIEVVLTEESYTSKTDHLIFEKMLKYEPKYKNKKLNSLNDYFSTFIKEVFIFEQKDKILDKTTIKRGKRVSTKLYRSGLEYDMLFKDSKIDLNNRIVEKYKRKQVELNADVNGAIGIIRKVSSVKQNKSMVRSILLDLQRS